MSTAPQERVQQQERRNQHETSGGQMSGFNEVSAPALPVAPLRVSFETPTLRVCRTLRIVQQQNYEYTGAVRRVSTRLCLIPPDVRGEQRLLSQQLVFAPLPYEITESRDEFGNQIREVSQEKVEKRLTFALTLELETVGYYDRENRLVPRGVAASVGTPPGETFLSFTRRTVADPTLELAARAARAAIAFDPQNEPLAFAIALCRWVFREMRYVSGSTGVGTTAAEAWAQKKGVCQDFAHIYLVISRLSGVPARYVSGFMPGEGAMHAWVETLVPLVPGEEPRWLALDPTHDRLVTEKYVTVAVGREYGDVAPNTGGYYGREQNTLRHHSSVALLNTHTEPLP